MRIPQLVGERFASFAFKVKVATFETLVLVVRHNFYVKSEYSVSGLHCTFFFKIHCCLVVSYKVFAHKSTSLMQATSNKSNHWEVFWAVIFLRPTSPKYSQKPPATSCQLVGESTFF